MEAATSIVAAREVWASTIGLLRDPDKKAGWRKNRSWFSMPIQIFGISLTACLYVRRSGDRFDAATEKRCSKQHQVARFNRAFATVIMPRHEKSLASSVYFVAVRYRSCTGCGLRRFAFGETLLLLESVFAGFFEFLKNGLKFSIDFATHTSIKTGKARLIG